MWTVDCLTCPMLSLCFLSGACVNDFLGVGIIYVYYIIVLAMCRSHPDLVSFAFSAIPIFYILIFNLLVIPQLIRSAVMYTCAFMCMRVIKLYCVEVEVTASK